jgi:hypothetical protein
MTLSLEIADEIARTLGSQSELARRAMEAFVLEEVRAGRLTRHRVRRVLGFASGKEADEFLKAHGSYKECPDLEFEQDLEAVKEWLVVSG